MSVSFSGFNEKVITFEAASGVKAGYPVTMSANGKVSASSADDNFIGIAIENENGGYASVQVEGAVTVTYSGDTAPTVGYSAICAAGSGKVEVDATNGMAKRVLSVDTTAKTAVILL